MEGSAMVVFLPQQPIAPTVSNHCSAEMMTSGSALEPGLRSQPDLPAEHLTTLPCKPPAGTHAHTEGKGGGRPSTGAEAERVVSHLRCDPVPSQRSESSGSEGLPAAPPAQVRGCSCLGAAPVCLRLNLGQGGIVSWGSDCYGRLQHQESCTGFEFS